MDNIRKILVLLSMMIIIQIVYFTPSTLANKYDVRYDAPSEKVTAKELDDYIAKNATTTEKKNGTKSILRGQGKTIIKVAEKYELNPHLFLAQIVSESGWGASPYAAEYNNLGGVQCMKGYKCSNNDGTGRTVTIFDSAEDSIEGIGKLLRKDYIDAGYDNLIKISERYVNGTPLDKITTGVPHYMDNILSIAEGMGVKFKPGEKGTGKGKGSADGDDKDEDDDGSGGKSTKGSDSASEDFNPFTQGNNSPNRTGVSTNFDFIPESMQYFLGGFLFKIGEYLMLGAYVLGGVMMVFLSLQVAVLTFRIRHGGSNSQNVQKAIDFLTGNIPPENLLKRIFINMGIVIFIFMFIFARVYIFVFKFFYSFLDEFMSLF